MTGSTIDRSGVGQLQSLYLQRSRELDPAIPVQNSMVLVRSLDSRKAHEYSKVPAWVPYPIRYAQSVQTCRLEARKLVHLYALAVGRISSPIGAMRNWAMAYSGHRSCVVEPGCPHLQSYPGLNYSKCLRALGNPKAGTVDCAGRGTKEEVYRSKSWSQCGVEYPSILGPAAK
jgi:hypothetical protein